MKASEPLEGRSSPYCKDMLKKFFTIVDTCLNCEDIAHGAQMATFLRPAFPACRVQQVSNLHLKFALK